MKFRVVVDELQIFDIAPRDENLHILRDEFCKVGEIISPQLSVSTTFDSLKKLDREEKSITSINDSDHAYNIRGEILAGILGHINGQDVHLIVDCGVLLRVCIKDPFEYELVELEDGDKRYIPVKKENPTKFVFRRNEFIGFSGEIKAMWLDTWEGIVRTNSFCKVVGRQERRRGELRDLLLTVDCRFPEEPVVEIDHYIAKNFRRPVIWGDFEEFSIEY